MLHELESLRYVGIFVGLVLTGAGLPLPEELLVIVAGVASFHGTMDPWLALATCMLGALLGDCAMYAIGYHFGHRLVRKRGWFARLLHAEREQKVERMIRQHGLKVLLLARFLAGLRAPVYIAAGILRVPFRKFVLVDTFCAALVIPIFFGASYLFADQIAKWWERFHTAQIVATIVVVCAILVGVYVYLRRRRKRLARELAARLNAEPEMSLAGEQRTPS